MPIVSVTRFRPRSILQMPAFAFHASRALSQIRRATGWIDGAVKRDADHALWTMTVWQDEKMMLAYLTGGAHGGALPSLRVLAVEASVVRWTTNDTALPEWSEAVKRMRAAGRASKLKQIRHSICAYKRRKGSSRLEGRPLNQLHDYDPARFGPYASCVTTGSRGSGPTNAGTE